MNIFIEYLNFDLILLLFVFGFPGLKADVQREKVNEQIDPLMEMAGPWLAEHGMDPMVLPDVEETIEIKCPARVVASALKLPIVFPINPDLLTQRGKVLLKNGKLWDLKQISRYGDAWLTYDGNSLKADASLIVKSVNIAYDYVVKLLNIGPNGAIKGYVENIVVSGSASVDTKTYIISLKKFEISKIGHIEITLEGNALFDSLANAVIGIGLKSFKNQIRLIFSQRVKTIVRQNIDDLNKSCANKNRTEEMISLF